VLVVDDEEVVRRVAVTMLESLGFSVVTANDGQQGVEQLGSSREPFIAVLLDLTMPRLDGLGALEQLKQLDLKVPIILMSGYDEQDVGKRFSGHGLAGFLQKPFSPEMLKQKLGLALAAKN
jgi:CheY-like chemotaxis protein